MIISNAVPSEKDSPFYKANEVFCNEFEKFVLDKKGMVKGLYNAWSYNIYAKIPNTKEWILEYKKSTFSSGNLFFTSKYQNLFVSVIWKTKTKDDSEFRIRRKKITDPVFGIFNNKISRISNHSKYVFISKKGSKVVLNLIYSLEELFDSNEVYEISSINNELKIELRTEKHYFNIFNKLTDLSI